MVVHRAALVPLALIFLVYFIATALGDLYPVEQLGAEFATREGRVTVLAVDPDSPAGRAGVRPGDRIVTVDGRQVRNALDWGAALAWVDVDRPLSLLIDRDGSVNQADLQFRLRPLGAWVSPESVVVVLSRAVQFVTLWFAFGIAARGRGTAARVGSWLLGTISS